jgi:hypothetical protein
MSLVFVVGIISIVDALTEPATLVPSVYRKFYKWGLPGRIALLGLGPGWPYGFGYFIVCMWLMFLGLLASEGWPLDAPLALVSLIGTVIWPVAWIRLFHSKAERTFVHYIVIQIILVLLTMLLFFMDEAADVEGVLYLGVFLPSVGLFYGNFYGDEEWEALAAIVIGVVSVLCLLVVGLAAHRHMRQVRGIVAGLAGESQGGRDGNASETPQ